MIESLRTLTVAGLGISIGVALGSVALALALALAMLLCWHQIQAYRLVRWLSTKKAERPKLPAGLWRRLAETIDGRLRRAKASKRERLGNSIDLMRRIRNLNKTLPDAVIVIDNDSNAIKYFNKAAHELFNLKKSDLHTPLEPADKRTEGVQSLSDDEDEEIVLVQPPGQPKVHLEERTLPFGNDQTLILRRDVTRFQKLETIRQDFIANVSHEIRTPLTSILGYLETALAESEVRDSSVGKILVKMMRPVQRMRTLVEDLMLLSNLDSTANPTMDALQVLDISQMIQDILAEVEVTAAGHHKFIVNVDEQLLLLGIEREITGAFSNLIFNAVRYSPDGGSIYINWHARDDGGARFEVKDHGIGIAAEHIPRLTERFYRVDVGRSRISGGTGLGLAIVKHALRRHNSELDINSTVNECTTMGCNFAAAFTEKLKTSQRKSEATKELRGAG